MNKKDYLIIVLVLGLVPYQFKRTYLDESNWRLEIRKVTPIVKTTNQQK